MHVKIMLYRNKNDFVFGSFKVRTGSAWMEISGRLKKTNNETVFIRMTFTPGKGTEKIYVNQEEE